MAVEKSRVAQIALSVADIEKSLTFYRDDICQVDVINQFTNKAKT